MTKTQCSQTGTAVPRRIAIMVGAGHVPGLNAVVMGAALAAGQLGWETVGIRDGFDGLLHPERYPDGGLRDARPGARSRTWTRTAPGILGQAPRVDPFHVRQRERRRDGRGSRPVRRAAERLKAERIDALIARRRRPGTEHPLQASPQGAQRRCACPGRSRTTSPPQWCRSASTPRSASRSRCSTGPARPPSRPQDRRRRGPGRAGGLARAAGRHRRVRRRGAHSRDPLRSRGGGGEADGEGDRPAALRAGGGGRRGDVRRRAASRGEAATPQGVAVAAGDGGSQRATSSGGRARPPRPWRPAAAAARRGDLPARPGALGPGRRPDGRRPSAGHGLRGRGGAGREGRQLRDDGGLRPTGHAIRAAGGRDQQGEDRARRRRVRPDRPRPSASAWGGSCDGTPATPPLRPASS